MSMPNSRQSPISERLANELDLLQAMYPDSVSFNPGTREVKYVQHQAGSLVVRLPDNYPEAGIPEVISASDADKNDLRTAVRAVLKSVLPADEGEGEGEEALDAILGAYQDILDKRKAQSIDDNDGAGSRSPSNLQQCKTVIIWLHHLLALSKRKLALSTSQPGVAGITKPGYPGVMIFSGPAAAVDEHVAELKRQNWQAFQVRYEEAVQWGFDNDSRCVREVETMAEAVKMIEDGGRREEFLKAVGVK